MGIRISFLKISLYLWNGKLLLLTIKNNSLWHYWCLYQFISVGRDTLCMCLLFHWDVHTFSYTAKRDCSHSRNETCCSHHPVINYQCKYKIGNTRTVHNIRGRCYYLFLQMSNSNVILQKQICSIKCFLWWSMSYKVSVHCRPNIYNCNFYFCNDRNLHSPHAIKDSILMFISKSFF